MAPRVMVTGVPGIGKTTITRNILIPSEYEVINFGDLMFKIGRREKRLKRKIELGSLNLQERKLLQMKAAEKIGKESKYSPIIIDGHLVVDSKIGFVPGLPKDCLSLLHLNSIILLFAKFADVVKRRQNVSDKYKVLKNWDQENRISVHHDVLFNYCLQYSFLYHSSFELLENPQDEIDETTKEMVEIVKSIIIDL